RPAPDPAGRAMVAAGTGRGLAPRVFVPPGGLPVRGAGAAGAVAGPGRDRARPAARLDAAGAGRRAAELRDRGGDRALRPGTPRAGRPRQGHGLGRGVRADAQRAGVLGPGPGPAPAVNPLTTGNIPHEP